MLLLAPAGLPGIPDVRQLFKDAIKWFLINTVEAFLDAATIIFSLGFETFLFYPNPAGISILDTLWQISFSAFVVIAGVSFLYIMLLAQYFPGTDTADLQHHTEQVAKYFIVIFISRELIAVGVAFTHALTGLYYKTSYDLSLGVTMTRQAMDKMGLFLSVQWGMLAALLLLLCGLGLLLILVARMLIIYVTYALLPLLMGLQLVEVGPWKRVNEMGEKFITASAKLMLFGLLVSALIWSSTLLTSFGGYDTPGGGTFAGGEPLEQPDVDASFAGSASLSTIITDFFYLLTPVLILDFIGVQLVMSLL